MPQIDHHLALQRKKSNMLAIKQIDKEQLPQKHQNKRENKAALI